MGEGNVYQHQSNYAACQTCFLFWAIALLHGRIINYDGRFDDKGRVMAMWAFMLRLFPLKHSLYILHYLHAKCMSVVFTVPSTNVMTRNIKHERHLCTE